MKILLFVPPQTIVQNQMKVKLHPPLGLASIAAYLSLEKWDVKIVDCYAEGVDNISYRDGYKRIGLQEKQIVRYIQSYKPNIIGISCNFSNFSRDLFELSKICKQYAPSMPIIAGGAHPSMDAVNVIKDNNIDIVVVGEGEETLKEICQRYIKGRDLAFTPGTVSRHNGRVVVNPVRSPINLLDELPIPSYKHLKMEIYIKDQIKNNTDPFAKRVPVGYIVSSRGCPFNCIFCSTTKVFKKYRTHSSAYIVRNIKYLIDEYRVKEIAFFDDCFAGGDNRLLENICDTFLNEKIAVPWTVPQGLLLRDVSDRILAKMRKSGFYRICLAIETGCPEIAKYIRKPIDLKKIKEIIIKCNKFGIYTIGSFVIGFPYEDRAQINETIRYALDSELDMINVFICQPHAGSEIYNIFRKENLLTVKDSTGSNFFFTKYNTKYFAAEELNKIREEFFTKFIKKRIFSIFTVRGFYLHVLSKIRSLQDIIYFLKILSKFIEARIKKRKSTF